jgi:hypothetical protein
MNFGAMTDYVITFTTLNPLPLSVSFNIDFPVMITLPSQLVSASISIGAGTSTSKPIVANFLTNVSPDSNSILLFDAPLTAAIPPNTRITIRLSQISNPIGQTQYTTLTLNSYTDKQMTGMIDIIPQGLVPQSACDYPCATCSSSSKSTCTSCLTKLDSVAEKNFF